MELPAYCPRCGDMHNLFSLVPDERHTVTSAACGACHATRKAQPPAERDDPPNVPGDPCAKCGAPTRKAWRYCMICRDRLIAPS